MADVKEVRLSKMSDSEAEQVFQRRRLEIISKMKGSPTPNSFEPLKPARPALRLKTL